MDHEVAFLRYQWIDCLRRRGEILENLPWDMASNILVEHQITPHEAVLCILLNRHLNGYDWNDYKSILVWWYNRGEELPSTPHEAVEMLAMWQTYRH
jgi:hypothetical protein